jgi:hypothetical protein
MVKEVDKKEKKIYKFNFFELKNFLQLIRECLVPSIYGCILKYFIPLDRIYFYLMNDIKPLLKNNYIDSNILIYAFSISILHFFVYFFFSTIYTLLSYFDIFKKYKTIRSEVNKFPPVPKIIKTIILQVPRILITEPIFLIL